MKHGMQVRLEEAAPEREALHEMLDRVLDSISKSEQRFRDGDLEVSTSYEPLFDTRDVRMQWTPRL